MGFPMHLIQLLISLFTNQEAAVRTAHGLSNWFSIGRGVRQGCIMSPSLYNLYSEDIMRDTLNGKDFGIKIGGTILDLLMIPH
jgi:hypothetical protein